ncbi:hypothetical protein B9Q09_01745 [Candidatus Marsarchaeota G2 archaeon ECH_B_SAG-C16]|uniref:Uncharacterized protein n=4 Tax=Candidatus Marsarchaeota group 2 TaxID=2203771 RepID=A0A2R6BCU3_9ARCH|nr:MAG: hypothetical protein B9Q06_02175 [Candidatus Marsarchaeota G2 archaeon ECH_B_2]PSN96990.1 MAG: hypothetical protein B9Q09_01745 [Candidatus Marsarchaeota G2 archaeon ECH_B_SAG-C16]PSO01129.1 MAG: hypothetical protein B9Q07_01520 [Candidatus Marsarchaeota G2 archaeon ECH_B_3]PSO02986.1 MAG: hypothetical protein B9Q05_02745 [Candidatus Marsarchaeota G2 archaeon ECH_B_1]
MKTSGKLGLATIFATLGLMGAFWPSMVSEELQQGVATNLALFFALMAVTAALFLGLGAMVVWMKKFRLSVGLVMLVAALGLSVLDAFPWGELPFILALLGLLARWDEDRRSPLMQGATQLMSRPRQWASSRVLGFVAVVLSVAVSVGLGAFTVFHAGSPVFLRILWVASSVCFALGGLLVALWPRPHLLPLLIIPTVGLMASGGSIAWLGVYIFEL